jgi:hypothetical protein
MRAVQRVVLTSVSGVLQGDRGMRGFEGIYERLQKLPGVEATCDGYTAPCPVCGKAEGFSFQMEEGEISFSAVEPEMDCACPRPKAIAEAFRLTRHVSPSIGADEAEWLRRALRSLPEETDAG